MVLGTSSSKVFEIDILALVIHRESQPIGNNDEEIVVKISKKIIFLFFVMSLNIQASLTLWNDLNIKVLRLRTS